MALAAVLDTLNGINESIASEYIEKDGKFHLDVTGLEDTGALKRAKDHEKSARQTAETKVSELAAKAEELQNKIDEISRGNIPKGDVESLEQSWKDKLEAANTSHATEKGELQSSLNNLLVDNVAQAMATEISTAPELLIPHIKSRLQPEIVEGKATTRVLDAEGKPSALTVSELSKEFVANEKFAPIIVGSKASGGGAGQQSGGNGGGASGKALNYATASPKEIAADIAAKKSQ